MAGMSSGRGARGVVPFLKWGGGKRWFAANYMHFLPEQFEAYIEPFLGSGAVFFKLQPSRAVLGDINQDVVELFKAVKNHPSAVARRMDGHNRRHSSGYYYRQRAAIS